MYTKCLSYFLDGHIFSDLRLRKAVIGNVKIFQHLLHHLRDENL